MNPSAASEGSIRIETPEAADPEPTIEAIHLPSEIEDTEAKLIQGISARVPGAVERSQAARFIASAISRKAHLDTESARIAETASALHEIGKLYLPKSLLPFPPEGSGADELATFEMHLPYGRQLAVAAGLPKRIGAAILHSRERWDGEGPQGLCREDIPVTARVTAIAREYAATSGAGPDSAPSDEAISRLRSAAGTRLDPTFVDLGVAVISAERSLGTQAGSSA